MRVLLTLSIKEFSLLIRFLEIQHNIWLALLIHDSIWSFQSKISIFDYLTTFTDGLISL